MLIHCPECDGRVSDAALSCPTCGYEITRVRPPTQWDIAAGVFFGLLLWTIIPAVALLILLRNASALLG